MMTLADRTLSEPSIERKASMCTALARRLRLEFFDLLHEKQTGHWGGSSSACELLTALYFHRMRIDPKRPDAPWRDRLVLSKGHASPLLYTVLAYRGYFDPAELRSFRDLDSRLQGHPSMLKTPGVDMSTGALGHGLSVGLGMALASRLSGQGFKTYVVLGEGCLNEGQSWEALMGAAKFAPPGLTLLVDANGVQLDGRSGDIMPMDPLEDKLRAFGWKVLPGARDGHNMRSIFSTFEELDALPEGPKAAVYRTVKGRGVSFMEGQSAWHGAPIDKDSYARGRPELVAAYSEALLEAGFEGEVP